MSLLLPVTSGMGLGLLLGLLGGGGALVAMPVLLLGFQMPFPQAVGTSLLLVSTGALPTLGMHVRQGNVAWGPAAAMGAAGSVGALAASTWADWIPASWLRALLIVLVLGAAWAMLRPGAPPVRQPSGNRPGQARLALLAAGFGIGLLTGLVGVGGGFLLVPALVLLGGCDPRRAIASSLAVIVVNALAGVAGYWRYLPLDDSRLPWLLVATAVGSIGGFLLGQRLAPQTLRAGFGVLLLGIAALLAFG